MFKFGKDEIKCSGCKACQLICALHNKAVCNPKEAFIEVNGENLPGPGGYKVRWLRGCTRCGECFKICPTDAIFTKPIQEAQE